VDDFAAPLQGADVELCAFPRVALRSTLGYSRAVPPGPVEGAGVLTAARCMVICVGKVGSGRRCS